MGSLAYTTSYLAIARNTTAAALVTKLAAVPRDVATETLLGLTNLLDTTQTFSGLYARRNLVYTSAPGALAPDTQLARFLSNEYTSSFSQALSTKVIQGPVVSVPLPQVPALWVNAQLGPSVTVTGAVSDWPNLSGSGVDLVQASGVRQPTYNPSGFAPNVATVHFDGTRFLQTAAALAYDEFTYLMTFQTPLLSTAGILCERSVNAAANPGERLYQSAAPTHSILARRSGVTHNADAAANWAIDGNWHVATFVYSHATGGKLELDDTTLASFAALGAQAVSDTVYVGSNQGVTLPMTGDLRELFIFPAALSDANIAALKTYMGGQVGLTL